MPSLIISMTCVIRLMNYTGRLINSWQLVEASSGIDLFLGVDRQVRSFRPILTQQVVDVLTSATLTGSVKVAEIDAYPRIANQVDMAYRPGHGHTSGSGSAAR
jgi:hypothetical protein